MKKSGNGFKNMTEENECIFFPFIVSAGIYIPHIIKGGSEQYENGTSTPIKASQKRKRKDKEKKCYKVKKHYESRPQLTKEAI